MLDHLRAALGEGIHLGGAGEAQDARDLGRGRLLGVEHQREAELVLEEDHLAEILHRAHARDSVLHAQLLAGQAAEHVNRVVVGHGDEQVRIADAGLAEHAVIRAVAQQCHHVNAVGKLLQTVLVTVHNRDVVTLVGQPEGHLLAHTARAYKYNIHRFIFSSFLYKFFWTQRQAREAQAFFRLLRRRPRLRGWAALAA